ncbi:hypothetical protein F5Y14DRAFT_453648 [Nemania sp. NC0429]|nr:hypothetical protein F5Y14DRAFT_453648 [Nemania sp. NC0429]
MPRIPQLPDPLPLLFNGVSQQGFRYFSDDCWKSVDYVMDNGLGRGYSGYRLNMLVGHGKLVVYDEIDKEMDIITGGPLAFGWVTHFPDDHSRPPPIILAAYQQKKRNFRRYFATLPFLEGAGLDSFLANMVGLIVYRLAQRDPTTYYGLGNIDDSARFEYCVGFNGIFHTFPTITTNINYLNTLFGGEYDMLRYLFPNSGSRNSGTMSDRRITGTRSDSD